MSLLIEQEERMVDLEKARRLMTERGMDMLVAASRLNVAYLAALNAYARVRQQEWVTGIQVGQLNGDTK